MNRKIFITLTLAALTLLCSPSLYSAPKFPPAQWRYSNIYDRNPWLRGDNVAGMRTDSLDISEALIGGNYAAGENRLSSEAPKQWSVGAEASTIMHLERFSMVGHFGFEQTTMYNACGGMFLEGGRYPVEIYEYTPGTKSRQVYSFDGGFSVDLTGNVRFGAVVDFKSTNCSKRKDLRYTDYALDLSFRPGFQWHSGKWSAGLAAALECNTETVTAEQIGVAETSYYAFLDKGMFYGLEQAWEGGGIHLSEPGISGFPVRELGFGVSAQLSWNEALYFDLSYLHGNGSMGEKDAIWMNFPSDRLSSTIQWKFSSPAGTEHILRLDGILKGTTLNENVIEKITQGGVTTRRTYGSNTVFTRSRFSLTPAWTAVRPSVYEAKLEISYSRDNELSSYQYPYINGQILRSIGFCFEGRYTAPCRLSPILGLWAGTGFLDESSRRAGEIESKTGPVRQQSHYDNWKWYMTSPSLGARVGLRYTFLNSLYLEASCRAQFRGGKNRMEAGLSFGYTF